MPKGVRRALDAIAEPHCWGHDYRMRRRAPDQDTPDLFPTATVRDTSALSKFPATEAATASQRYVLPKNLRNAVKHLSDGELDLMHAATLEEIKRRGRTPQSLGTDLQSLRHRFGRPDFMKKQSSPTKKRRKVDIAEVSLTQGQVNLVRSAFKAGITPSRIARQFGISQSNVRKALAPAETKG